MMNNIDESIRQLEDWIQKTFEVSRKEVKDLFESSADKMVPSTSSIVNRTVNTVTNILFLGIIIFITTFLLLLYRRLIVLFFVTLFADEHTVKIYSIFGKTRYVVRNYIVGLCIEMVIVAVANCSIFFLLGCKICLVAWRNWCHSEYHSLSRHFHGLYSKHTDNAYHEFSYYSFLGDYISHHHSYA